MSAHFNELVRCEDAVASFSAAVATLRPRPDKELRRLWLAAADASDAFSAVCGKGSAVSDFEFNRAQEAEYEANQALRVYLLNAEGLTTADLKRSVL